MVGTNTVLEDNPSLTARDWKGSHPIRYVIDRKEALSKKHDIFNNTAETIVISEKNIAFNQPIAKQICNILFQKNIQSIIIEGGAQTLQTFIDENLWDEARVFTGAITLKEGIKAPRFSGNLISEQTIVKDRLKVYLNT